MQCNEGEAGPSSASAAADLCSLDWLREVKPLFPLPAPILSDTQVSPVNVANVDHKDKSQDHSDMEYPYPPQDEELKRFLGLLKEQVQQKKHCQLLTFSRN